MALFREQSGVGKASRFSREFLMRPWLFLSLLIALSPCVAAEELPVPPNGQQILQIFFQNINKPLKDEPWCQMQFRNHFWGDLGEDVEDDDPRYLSKTLAEVVAAQIGESSSRTPSDDYVGPVIYCECQPGLGDTNNPDFPKGWYCSVNFIEGTRELPRETATTIQMIIKPDLSGIVPGSIFCM